MIELSDRHVDSTPVPASSPSDLERIDKRERGEAGNSSSLSLSVVLSSLSSLLTDASLAGNRYLL